MINPFTHRKVLKKGMPGRATIVARSVPAHGATSFNMAMTLQVHVEGSTPYEVEDQWMVKAKDTEALDGSIPIKVDRSEHDKVAIDWDLLREEHEQHKRERREALASGATFADPSQATAAALAGELGAALEAAQTQAQAQPAQEITPVVDMQNDPELRAKIEKILGRKLTPGTTERIGEGDPALQMRIMQVVQEHMAEKATATSAASPSPSDGEDTVSQLERLASLRDTGVLSDEEFEQAKRKILEEG